MQKPWPVLAAILLAAFAAGCEITIDGSGDDDETTADPNDSEPRGTNVVIIGEATVE